MPRMQQSLTRSGALSLWNATSHADRRGHAYPSAPTMQHYGGADHGRPPPLATNS